jgi:hypothetical protein
VQESGDAGGEQSSSPAAVEEGQAETADDAAREAQTDVVTEQLGAGAEEPAPTPAPGGSSAVPEDEEVKGEEQLEKVDEAVEEAKEAEAGVVERKDTPVVEEEGVTDSAEPAAAEGAQPAVPESKQERVENPIYTLEVVGNKYKTDAFW